MDDTSEEFKQRVHDELMSRSPAQRLAMASRMHESARSMVLASLPSSLTAAERRQQLFLRFYSHDFPAETVQSIAAKL